MSPNLESPVQTQMAVAVLNRSLSSASDYHTNKADGKPVGWRRVFVQTDKGCVLGIELDRSDNVHTVKRRLQLALNVPTEESSLTFGDLVLKNDLSAVRNDSPLLLTRSLLHRSSSTPCLSPNGKDLQQRDRSAPIEILGCSIHCFQTKQLVKEVKKAIENGVDPIPVHSGLGGAYYFKNCRGECIAIVKPTDEEPFAPNNPKGFVGKTLGQPGLKRSVRVGETGFREVAAYLLDYDNFANVPPTILVKVSHSAFNVNEVNGSSSKAHDRKHNVVSKIASFQQFIPHDFDASDHGTSSFPVAAVHRIGILDIRIFNTDRHAGNLLVRKLNDGAGRFGAQVELIPIDHGLCLPESLEDPYFEWIHWPQASIPFSEEELKYIANLDPVRDSDMLRMELPMIREACLRVLALCTIFLKEAAAFGLCLADIGEMMSREFKGMEEEPSELEVVCMEARRLIGEREPLSLAIEVGEEEQFQFDIDSEDHDFVPSKISPTYYSGFKGGHLRNPFSKLECVEEGDDGDEDGCGEMEKTASFSKVQDRDQLPTIGQLSMSMKSAGLGDKSPPPSPSLSVSLSLSLSLAGGSSPAMEDLIKGLVNVALGGGGAGDGDARRSHRRDGGEEAGDGGGEREERSRSSWAEVVASGEHDADGDRPAHGDRRPQQQTYEQKPGAWGRPSSGWEVAGEVDDGRVSGGGRSDGDWETVGGGRHKKQHQPRPPAKVEMSHWGGYKRPPSEQEYMTPDGVDTEPTPEELRDLSKACSRLWELDLNRLVPGKDYEIDCGEGKKVYHKDDVAPASLFSWLGDGVFRRPTYSRFCSLLDNYNPSQGRREVVTSEEEHEQAAFMEEICRTAPIRYLCKCLASRGIVSGDEGEFKRMLTGLWFDLYGRGGVSGSSSAFEHVFVGEIKEQGEGEVSGFHNWIQFYLEEAKGRVDYHGYIFPRRRGQEPDSETQLLTIQFEWNGVLKAVSSTLIGVSPEFEVALYTLCFFLGGEDNHVRLGPYSVNIKCYRHGNDRIGSVFPISVD